LRYILAIFFLLLSFSFSLEVEVVEDFNPNTNIETIKEPQVEQQKIIKKDNQKPKKETKIKEPKKNNITLTKKTNKKLKKSKKGVLVIIIDDISHRFQLNEIKNLHIKITPSIFPPNKMNMHSNLLAKGLKHYLIHLPLESHSKAMNRMHKTLFTYYSKKQIINRVKEIRRLFPNAKYVNNHTGSVFCANYKKSKILYKALLDNGFKFVDSRTTQKTKFKKIAKEFGRRYIKNDMFLDNKLSVNATLNQIKKAIYLAKHNGFAIVIGHPHPTTFKALKLAKKYLKDVEVKYLDEVYWFRKL